MRGLIFALGVFALSASAQEYQSPYLSIERGHVPTELQRFDFGSVMEGLKEYEDVVDFLYEDRAATFRECVRAENAKRYQSIDPQSLTYHFGVIIAAAEDIQQSDKHGLIEVPITPNRVSAVFIVGLINQSRAMELPPKLFEAIGNGLSDQEKKSVLAVNILYLSNLTQFEATCAD